MQSHNQLDFLNQFFHFTNPIPSQTPFTQEDLKNNDMKITLEIATRSTLRMQSDPKTGLVSFSCKNFGKNCFEIFAFKNVNHYFISTNYSKLNHHKNCELKNQSFEYLKIYNLMKLKTNLIESIMLNLNLFHSSPSEILAKISHDGEYFFEKNINYHPELRRKLRKRFDNIINIDIKKITKGGREEIYHQTKALKQKDKKQQQFKVGESSSEFDETSFYEEKKAYKKKKTKMTKNREKNRKKQKTKNMTVGKQNKQNQCMRVSQTWLKKPFQKIEDQIYDNPASICELKEIKELNQQFNCYEDIFTRSFEQQPKNLETQTINDKLRENVFLSLRNSLIKKSLDGQSLEHLSFPEDIELSNEKDLLEDCFNVF